VEACQSLASSARGPLATSRFFLRRSFSTQAPDASNNTPKQKQAAAGNAQEPQFASKIPKQKLSKARLGDVFHAASLLRYLFNFA
jgi:hypothetical protein